MVDASWSCDVMCLMDDEWRSRCGRVVRGSREGSHVGLVASCSLASGIGSCRSPSSSVSELPYMSLLWHSCSCNRSCNVVSSVLVPSTSVVYGNSVLVMQWCSTMFCPSLL